MFFKNELCQCIIKSQALLRSAGDGACVGWGSGRGGLGGEQEKPHSLGPPLWGHCCGPGSAPHGLLTGLMEGPALAAERPPPGCQPGLHQGCLRQLPRRPQPPSSQPLLCSACSPPSRAVLSLRCSPFILPSKPSSGASPCGDRKSTRLNSSH